MSRHLMLDLETLGTGPDAAICSIGAVLFDLETGDIPATFSAKVEFSPSMGVCDPNTVEWWLRQTEEARRELLAGDRKPLVDCLKDFRTFAVGPRNEYKVDGLWSNGPTFDEVIIRNAMKRLDVFFPVSFRNSRCCRTMFALARTLQVEPESFEGVPHSAVDDALNQARAMIKIHRHIVGEPRHRDGAEL